MSRQSTVINFGVMSTAYSIAVRAESFGVVGDSVADLAESLVRLEADQMALSIARVAESLVNIDGEPDSTAMSVANRALSLSRVDDVTDLAALSIARKAESLAARADSYAVFSIPSSGEHQIRNVVKEPEQRGGDISFDWESKATL